MSNYVTTTSISLILPGYLKGNTTTSDTEGTSAFSGFIDDAEGRVNSVLATRYSLPFSSSSIPPLIISLTKDLACYYAMRATAYRSGQKNEYAVEFKSAMDTLKNLMNGELNLAYTDGSLVPRKSTQRMMSSSEDYSPIFNLDAPENWELDNQQADDIASSRS